MYIHDSMNNLQYPVLKCAQVHGVDNTYIRRPLVVVREEGAPVSHLLTTAVMLQWVCFRLGVILQATVFFNTAFFHFINFINIFE